MEYTVNEIDIRALAFKDRCNANGFCFVVVLFCWLLGDDFFFDFAGVHLGKTHGIKEYRSGWILEPDVEIRWRLSNSAKLRPPYCR